jgi:hypothetical protein
MVHQVHHSAGTLAVAVVEPVHIPATEDHILVQPLVRNLHWAHRRVHQCIVGYPVSASVIAWEKNTSRMAQIEVDLRHRKKDFVGRKGMRVYVVDHGEKGTDFVDLVVVDSSIGVWEERLRTGHV